MVIFEKGRNHLLDLDDLTDLLGDFSNDEIKFIDRHFLGPDPSSSPAPSGVSPTTATTPSSAR